MTNKPTPAHTPTPWKIRGGACEVSPVIATSDNETFAALEIDIIANGNERRIAQVSFCTASPAYCGIKNLEEAKANAAHIVRCVNSHDVLVEVTERFVKWLGEGLATTISVADLKDEALAALQLAKGE